MSSIKKPFNAEGEDTIPPGRLVSTSVYIIERAQQENLREYHKYLRQQKPERPEPK